MADLDIDLTTATMHPVAGGRGDILCVHDGGSSVHVGVPRTAEGRTALRRLAQLADAMADGIPGDAEADGAGAG